MGKTWRVWVKEREQVEQWVRNETQFSMVLAMAPGLSVEEIVDIKKSVAQGRFRVEPSASKEGRGGFDLVVHY